MFNKTIYFFNTFLKKVILKKLRFSIFFRSAIFFYILFLHFIFYRFIGDFSDYFFKNLFGIWFFRFNYFSSSYGFFKLVFSKLLRLLLTVTELTKSNFWPKGQKKSLCQRLNPSAEARIRPAACYSCYTTQPKLHYYTTSRFILSWPSEFG